MTRLLLKRRRPDPRECEETRALMSDYVDGDLDAGARTRIDRHIRRCRRCRQVLTNLRHTLAGLRALGERGPAGGGDPDQAAERITRAWRERA